jgi:hypothetical protein
MEPTFGLARRQELLDVSIEEGYVNCRIAMVRPLLT